MLMIDDSSDADLARAVAGRSPGSAQEAEGALYRRFAPRVRLYGLRHLRSEDAACDLVQQVMLVTIEKLRDGSVRDLDQIASFVLGMSRSMAKDIKRLEWRREKLLLAFTDPNRVEAPASDTTLDADRLEACLGRLAERERLVVLLTFYADRTSREVATELGVQDGNVRVIRHRAIERLRTCMMTRDEVR